MWSNCFSRTVLERSYFPYPVKKVCVTLGTLSDGEATYPPHLALKRMMREGGEEGLECKVWPTLAQESLLQMQGTAFVVKEESVKRAEGIIKCSLSMEVTGSTE